MPFDGAAIDPPVIQALWRGRKNLEQGWCQGAAITRDGVCMTAAVHAALQDVPDYVTYKKAYMLLLRAVKETGFSAGGLAEFNDTPGRTKDEVLAVYDRAVELAFVAA